MIKDKAIHVALCTLLGVAFLPLLIMGLICFIFIYPFYTLGLLVIEEFDRYKGDQND